MSLSFVPLESPSLMSVLTELVPLNVRLWPRGKDKIDHREQRNDSRESRQPDEWRRGAVALPDIMA